MAKRPQAGAAAAAKPTDARILRSRAALIAAGRELLNQNYEATLSDIASQAGVGRATLYRLFESKQELVKAIAVDCLQAFDRATAHIESTSGSALEAIRMIYQAVMPLSAEMQFLMELRSFELQDDALALLYDEQRQAMRELVELGKQEGSLNSALPTEWLVNVIDGLLYSAWLLRADNTYGDDELAELAFRTFCSGAGAPHR